MLSAVQAAVQASAAIKLQERLSEAQTEIEKLGKSMAAEAWNHQQALEKAHAQQTAAVAVAMLRFAAA